MLQIVNRTKLKAALSLYLDSSGRELLSVVAKGTFRIPEPRSEPALSEEQLDIVPTDVHFADPGTSSVKYPADLVPGKVATDVLFLGSARAPEGRPVRWLETSLRIGPVARSLIVTGDRFWEASGVGGFRMSEPQSFAEMPIVYERAFGGMDPKARDAAKAWDRRNPVGVGYRVNSDSVEGTRIPNIEEPQDRIGSWKDRPPVAGLGPLASAWEPRVSFAGTYDAAWEHEQAPLPPKDLDPRFFNAAPSALWLGGFLRGWQKVELVNLGGSGQIAFDLPIPDVEMTLRLGSAEQRQAAGLWMLLLEPEQRRYALTWGASFPIGKQPSKAFEVAVAVPDPLASRLGLRSD